LLSDYLAVAVVSVVVTAVVSTVVVVVSVTTAVVSTVVVSVVSAGLLLQADKTTTEAATKAKNTFFILLSFLVRLIN
jgi:hypothetical protein